MEVVLLLCQWHMAGQLLRERGRDARKLVSVVILPTSVEV